MNMLMTRNLSFLVLLAIVSNVQAQPASLPPSAMVEAHDPVLALAAAQMSNPAVKGAPYCADATTELLQTLADGNRISRKHVTHVCRDAEGRTRQEVVSQMPRGEVRRVFIRDTVSHELWMLVPDRKVAIRLPSLENLPPPPAGHAAPEQQARWKNYAQRVREWARGTPPPPPPLPPGESQGAAAAEAVVIAPPPATGREKKAIEVTRWLGAEGMAPQMLSIMNRRPTGKGVTQQLAAKSFEGVSAEGTLTTWTIEAGTMGNEKPILITREEWRSPELKLPLMSRYVDPRSGEHVFRLSKLSRTPPAPELFKVPADYRVRER